MMLVRKEENTLYKEEDMYEQVCKDCGSNDVEVKMWVNPNTNEVTDDTGDGNIEDNWCNQCQCNIEIIPADDYIPKEEDTWI